MPLTSAQVKADFDKLVTEIAVANSIIIIGAVTVTGQKGTTVNANTVNEEGLTNGYVFSVWVKADDFTSETLKPLITKVTVDTVEYLLLANVPQPGKEILRLDIRNTGRI